MGNSLPDLSDVKLPEAVAKQQASFSYKPLHPALYVYSDMCLSSDLQQLLQKCDAKQLTISSIDEVYSVPMFNAQYCS